MSEGPLRTSCVERFLRYVTFDTQSSEASRTYPSTAGQLVLLRQLVGELHELGLRDAAIDEHGYVTATLPATTRKAGVPVIGLIAHVDTSPEMSGAGVKPLVHRNYQGQDLVLPDDPTVVLRAAEIPYLAERIGDDIVTASGTTLLGADNKAGVAEIMAAAEYLLAHPEIAHGAIRIAFTPDEEVGAGTRYFDVAKFGARCAYTIDGGRRGELEFESFSADAMTFTFQGRNTHPGYAKGAMVNAVKVAADFLSRLPREGMSPETTDGREGYVHPYVIDASVDRTAVKLLIRDFRTAGLAEKESFLTRLASRPPPPGRAPPSPPRSRRATATCGRRWSGIRRWWSTPARPFAGPASNRASNPSAAAPTARASASWACRRPTCSPASRTSTPAANGSPPRTWTRRSR